MGRLDGVADQGRTQQEGQDGGNPMQVRAASSNARAEGPSHRTVAKWPSEDAVQGGGGGEA